ncbi:MAG: pyridoxamine 5'-phosphate oxidase family protein [Proteobacteria bacterium]|nr:pyridoxamine 5'-phosphate oxidase family protein [Pseudomonadota bacterium]MDA1310056.1 pyridoxamine 5'-phosphate oxidase family protein [Pseudomonadota bacterium]
MAMFHEGNRALQDKFDGRRLADSLERNRRHATFTEADRSFIETAPFFFLATAAGETVDCSFKGGMPGFVRVTGENTLSFPDYDGNSMYKSLGNIMQSGNVGLLFIRFDGSGERMRISGAATIDDDPARVAGFEGAKMLVDVTARHIFPNCPRYIPAMEGFALSENVPRPDYTPPDAVWKLRDYARDHLPAGDRERLFGEASKE